MSEKNLKHFIIPRKIFDGDEIRLGWVTQEEKDGRFPHS